MYATRLIHPSPRVEERIAHYIRHMPDAIRSFGGMGLNAFGFGCTASSYAASLELEDQLPVISSNLCLAWALTRAVTPEQAPATPGQLLAQRSATAARA